MGDVDGLRFLVAAILRGGLLTGICLPLCLFVPGALIPTAIVGGGIWLVSLLGSVAAANQDYDPEMGPAGFNIFQRIEDRIIDFVLEDVPEAIASAACFLFSKKYRAERRKEKEERKELYSETSYHKDEEHKSNEEVKNVEEQAETKFSSKKQLSTNKNKQQDSCKE